MTAAERRSMFVVLLVGLALRALLVATTRGTSDLDLWATFTWLFRTYGLNAYGHLLRLNHPPLAIAFVALLEKAGPLAITLRASQALADVVTAFCIHRIAIELDVDAKFAAAIYFLSPAVMLTSSFFCNTDSMLVALIALTVLLILRRRHAWAGAAFALSVGIKVLPLFLFPLYFLVSKTGRAKFIAAAAVVGALIVLPVALHDPAHLLRNVVGYGGSGEMWGLALPATLAGAAGKVLHWPRFRELAYAAGDVYLRIARFVIAATVVTCTAIYWKYRRNELQSLPAGVALVLLGVVTAAPRVTLGYFVWFLPFLTFAVSRRLALTVYLVAAVQLVLDYVLDSLAYPWPYADLTNTTEPWWLGRAIDVAGVPLWLLCSFALFACISRLRMADSHR